MVHWVALDEKGNCAIGSILGEVPWTYVTQGEVVGNNTFGVLTCRFRLFRTVVRAGIREGKVSAGKRRSSGHLSEALSKQIRACLAHRARRL